MPKDICIWSCAEAYTVHFSGKANVRLRWKKDICPHAGLDTLKRTFAKVADCPPSAGIDQREHLLTHMRVSTLGNRKVGYTRVERCVDPTIIEIVSCGFYR